MSIKFKSSIESEGKIIQSKHRAIKHTDTVQTLEVKVVTKTAAHPHHGTGTYGYTIDGVEGAYLELTPGITYRFDQSDGSNGGTGTGGNAHPLRFATAKDAAGSTAYTGSEVTTNGSPGSSGAYTQIIPTTTTPPILHYYCSSHGNMGSYAKFGTKSATDLTGFDTDDLAESSTKKYLTQTNLGQRSIGDLSDVNLTGVANNKILKYDSSTSKFIIADDGGSSSSAITVQEEGNSLSTAATTLNFVGSSVTATGSGATKTITISGTGGSGGQVTVQKNVSGTSPTQATDGSRTDFTISSTPASKNNLQIYIDGVYQAKTAFEVSGTTVTLDAAPASGAVVEIIHFTVIDANIFLQSHTATSGQTSFNAGGLIATKNDTQVYIDGVYQNKGNYSISGSNVVLNPAPATGAVVEIVNIKATLASSGSVTWETAIEPQTGTSFDAAAGKGYFVNTTSGEITVNLPAGSAGDEIHFTDYASNFNTNAIRFDANGTQKILNSTDDKKCTIKDAIVRLVYQDDTKGWTGENLSDISRQLQLLLVAGGGASLKSAGCGGGGAGGVLEGTLNINPGTTIGITIGAGGAGDTGSYPSSGTSAQQGSNTVFTIDPNGSPTAYTALGGGKGGGYTVAGANGGSGGGGGGSIANSTNTAAGTSSQSNVTHSFGSLTAHGTSGGVNNSNGYDGGGGGGAGSAGGNSSFTGGSTWHYGHGGDGGNGLVNTILSTSEASNNSVGEVVGTSVYFAGGGGGGTEGTQSTSQGTGGHGGGGNGFASNTVYTNANSGGQNTGGGAGGSGVLSTQNSAPGGSGVAIMKIVGGAGSTFTNTGSPVLFDKGSDKIAIFKGTGTIIV